MSPDPYDGSYDPANPQSFNRYSYVMNNPLAAIDPSGLNQDTNGDGGSGCDPTTSACPPPSGQGSEGASGGPDYSGTPTSAPNGSQWQDQYGQYWTVQNGLLESLNTATDVGGGIPTGQADCMIFNCYIGSGLPIGFGSGSAPNNGTKPTLLSCTFTGKVGLSLASTALDFAGSVPVANEITGSIQIGVGIVSAGITVYQGNVNNAGFAGTGIGLALAGRTLGKGAAETIPVLGNAVSFLSGVYDVFGSGGVIDTYKSCLAGH